MMIIILDHQCYVTPDKCPECSTLLNYQSVPCTPRDLILLCPTCGWVDLASNFLVDLGPPRPHLDDFHKALDYLEA